MRRLLLLGTASVLVVTACGAGASPAPRLSNVAARTRPNLQAIAAARRRRAGLEAQKLLNRVVLPRGARPIGKPAVLSRPDTGISLVHELAWRYAFRRVRLPLESVYAFVKAHPPRGFRYYGGGGLYRSLDFDNGVAGSRQQLLTVDLARVGGRTVLRLEAGAPWIYPRSPREVVPRGVREIDIRNGHLRRRVRRPANVARIVRWFDELDVVQPGTTGIECPLILASTVTFVFRSVDETALAKAVAPSRPASACSAIEFTVGGKRQRPLIDGDSGRRAFVNRVQRLLGVRFTTPD
jgi:hypothetical protein